MLSDPVLAFIKGFRLRGSTENLKRAALSKFDDVLMSSAKKALWDSECSAILSAAGLTFQQRRGSERRTQAAADLDDILIAFDKLDANDNVPEIYCEAADLARIPPIVADTCTELVQRNSSSLQSISSKLESLSSDISGLSSKLLDVQSQIGASPSVLSLANSSQGSSNGGSGGSRYFNSRVSHASASVDRRDNLIVFGLTETQSMSDTMDSVQKMLEFVIGRPTQVKDLFRLGKKPESGQSNPTRPRPIHLKLASNLDRRLVLADRLNFRSYSIKGIFVREDLSPEVRQLHREKFASRSRSDRSPSRSAVLGTAVTPK